MGSPVSPRLQGCAIAFCDTLSPTRLFQRLPRGGHTRSLSEHGSQAPHRRWYLAHGPGRVGRRWIRAPREVNLPGGFSFAPPPCLFPAACSGLSGPGGLPLSRLDGFCYLRGGLVIPERVLYDAWQPELLKRFVAAVELSPLGRYDPYLLPWHLPLRVFLLHAETVLLLMSSPTRSGIAFPRPAAMTKTSLQVLLRTKEHVFWKWFSLVFCEIVI